MPVTELQGTRVSPAYNAGGRPISTAMAAVWLERVLSGLSESASEDDQQAFVWDAGWVDYAARLGRLYRMRERLPRPWLSASREDDETPEQQLFAALDLRLSDAGEEAASGGVATLLSWIAARPHPRACGYVIGLPTNTVAVAVAMEGQAYLFDPDAGVFCYASAAALADDAADYIHGSSTWFRNRASRAYGYAVSLNRLLEEEDVPATKGLTRAGGLTRGRGAASESPLVERRPTGRLFGASKLRRRQGDALAGARLRSSAPRTEVALIYADYVTETFSGGQSTRRTPETGARKDASPGAQWPLIGLRLDRRRLVSRITFQLVATGPRGPVPIWSETWDRRTARARLREFGPYRHPRLKDEGSQPLEWTAAIPWSALVKVAYTRQAAGDPFAGNQEPFAGGVLPPAYAPYKVYLTVNDGAPDSGGHSMVAATFLNLLDPRVVGVDEADEVPERDEQAEGGQDAADASATASGSDDEEDADDGDDEDQTFGEEAGDQAVEGSDEDEEWDEDDDPHREYLPQDGSVRTVTLVIEDKAGEAYLLDDGILPQSSGQVDDDGSLYHLVATDASGCVITFKDGSPPLQLIFESDEDGDWLDSDDDIKLLDDDEEDATDWLQVDDVDDERMLSLVVYGGRDRDYEITFTLPTGVSPPVTGTLEAIDDEGEDALLTEAVPPGAIGARVQLLDSPEMIELVFADR